MTNDSLLNASGGRDMYIQRLKASIENTQSLKEMGDIKLATNDIVPTGNSPALSIGNSTPGGGDFLDAADVRQEVIPLVSATGFSSTGIIDVDVYCDALSAMTAAMNPLYENYKTNITSQKFTINNAGVFQDPAGATSASLRSYATLGYLMTVIGDDALKGEGKLNLNVVNPAGTVIYEFPFKLNNLVNQGTCFVQRSAIASMITATPAAGAIGAYGPWALNTDVTFTNVPRQANTVLKAIYADTDASVVGYQNYVVITGKNVTIEIYPVVFSKIVRYIWAQHMFVDNLKNFGRWMCLNYLDVASVNLF